MQNQAEAEVCGRISLVKKFKEKSEINQMKATFRNKINSEKIV
jgi:hypothetical protein